MQKRTLTAMAVIAASPLILLAAACGGGSDSGGATPTSAPATPARTATTAPAATATAAAPSPATAEPTSPTGGTPPTQAPAASATSAVPTVAPTQAPPPPPPPPPSGDVSITVVAKDLKFTPSSLSATAGATIHITLDNQDTGVAHDITFFDPSGSQVATTDVLAGPVTSSTSFTASTPGAYAFKCSVHPVQMRGVLTVQ